MTRSISKAAASIFLVATCGAIVFLRIPTTKNNDPSRHAGFESPPPLSALPPISSSSASNSNADDLPNRRLSEALPNGGCHLTWPVKPPPGVAITYAASYPGCGARMTWNLVEALTGMWTGDDWNNNGRGDEVITVKTHYPQSNGILVEFDEKIQRGFIVIRNPMKSIPSFFNHIYEMRNHLPVHSERAPVEEWVKWRNAYLVEEIAEYKKFICYWMDRYTSENRLLMTYEGLTDDLIGAEVARGLNDFLGQVPGVTAIADESVPCIWRAVVKNQPPPQQAEQIKRLEALALNQPQNQDLAAGDAQATEVAQHQAPGAGGTPGQPQSVEPLSSGGGGIYSQQQLAQVQQTNLRRRLDLGHHNSQRKGPEVPRPYLPEDLEKMMDMLLEVADRYHQEDIRLYHIMMGYYEKVRAARIKLSPDEAVRKPPGGYY